MTATRHTSDDTAQSFWADTVESLARIHDSAERTANHYNYFASGELDNEDGYNAWREYYRAIFGQMVVIGKNWA